MSRVNCITGVNQTVHIVDIAMITTSVPAPYPLGQGFAFTKDGVYLAGVR